MSILGGGAEFDLIRGFLANARKKHPGVTVGAGDDAAILTTAPFAVSVDMSVENVHFRREWLEPAEIGYRAAVVALSDLAAVGAQPVAALISFAFSRADANGWANSVMEGATRALDEYGLVLAGGDITRTEAAAVIDVVMIGKAERPVLRSAAQPGDEVWVTGSLGGSAAALAALRAGKKPDDSLRARYARPAARTSEALWLRKQGLAGAMIDLSDGIAGDAEHIAAASNCKVVIDAARLPVHAGANLQMALQGGEDYELCFTALPGRVEDAREAFEAKFGITLTRIGDVVAGSGLQIDNADVSGGFDHFAEP